MSKSDEAKAREHRLAAKLRENLKRRKGLAGTKGAGAAADRKPPPKIRTFVDFLVERFGAGPPPRGRRNARTA